MCECLDNSYPGAFFPAGLPLGNPKHALGITAARGPDLVPIAALRGQQILHSG